MKLYHIVAFSQNRVIGKGNDIPWENSQDMRRFAEITRGHPIIMGRKTFESMGSKPLPGRVNIVLSRSGLESGPEEVAQAAKSKTSTIFCRSIEDAFVACEGRNEVYIIGGSTIYEQTMDHVHELRTTQITEAIEEDDSTVFYPEIDPEIWQVSFREAHATHTYVDYIRR